MRSNLTMQSVTENQRLFPPVPSGKRRAEFYRALREAESEVCEALHRYCDCYQYTGSTIVGERLAAMGMPDHICAAAEIVCEMADEEGIDPRLCPIEGAVHPEHLAAALGWLKIIGNNLPKTWLGRFAWHEDENWFVHPEQAPVVEMAGLKIGKSKGCCSFKRPAHELPIDPPPYALLFRTRSSACAVVCVINGIAYADPVNVLPEQLRATIPLCGTDWTSLTIAGMSVEVRATGGDGLFMGVAVDTGQMMRFNWERGQSAFDVSVENEASTCA